MWQTVLVLALMSATDPVRLGIILLVASRPRPSLNLLAYWLGAMMASISTCLIPVVVLHFAPMFTSLTHKLATSTTTTNSVVGHIQLVMGVLALSIAAVLLVRLSPRQRAHLPISGGSASTLVTEPTMPTAIARLLNRNHDAAAQDQSPIRRLLGRAHSAWENGSLWVAFVVGTLSGPPPAVFLFLLATIVVSGASLGIQVSAGVAFTVGMLAAVEIVLVGYLATPAKTHAVMHWVRTRAWAHRRKLLLGILVLAGTTMLASGVGSV